MARAPETHRRRNSVGGRIWNLEQRHVGVETVGGVIEEACPGLDCVGAIELVLAIGEVGGEY